MKTINNFFFVKLTVGFALLIIPDLARACATCYGAPDDPMTAGMNMAIFLMLGVTGGVLGSIVTFMIYLRNRAKKMLNQG